MPSAPKYLTDRWPDDRAAHDHLDGKIDPTEITNGLILWNEGHTPSEDDWSAADYLVMEWDYDYWGVG